MQALLRTMFKTVLWHATWWRHVAMYVGMLAGVLEVWDVCISRHGNYVCNSSAISKCNTTQGRLT